MMMHRLGGVDPLVLVARSGPVVPQCCVVYHTPREVQCAPKKVHAHNRVPTHASKASDLLLLGGQVDTETTVPAVRLPSVHIDMGTDCTVALERSVVQAPRTSRIQSGLVRVVPSSQWSGQVLEWFCWSHRGRVIK